MKHTVMKGDTRRNSVSDDDILPNEKDSVVSMSSLENIVCMLEIKGELRKSRRKKYQDVICQLPGIFLSFYITINGNIYIYIILPNGRPCMQNKQH